MTEDEKVFRWLYDIRNRLIPYYYAIEKNRFKKNKFRAYKIMRKAYRDLYYTFPKLDEFINLFFRETIKKEQHWLILYLTFCIFF